MHSHGECGEAVAESRADLRRFLYGRLRGIEHIFNKYPVACGGVADEDVGNGPHDLAVLDNGAARHECGQVGTTVFNEKFKSQKRKQRIK